MADAKSLFDKGEDVTALFDKGQDVAAPSEYGMLGAGAMGALKGASLGFDDEIAGMATAITKKIGGSEKDFWDIYREIRDSVRTEHKEAEAQQPVASFVGELAGGFAVPGLAVGKGALQAATTAQKIASMAGAGARAGAAYGLGASETELSRGEPGNVAKAIEETGSSMALGALLGGGGQAIGSGIAKGVKAAKGFPSMRDISDVFKTYKGGEKLLGRIDELSQANRDMARALIDDLENLRRLHGKAKEGALTEIDNSGLKVRISDLADEIQNKLKGMSSAEPSEVADIEKFKTVVGNIVKDETKEVVKLIPKPQVPKVSAQEKAAAKVAKKTAEAEAKDAIKITEIQDEIERLAAAGADDKELAPLYARLDKLKPETQYPPTNIVEELTGLDVKGVSRGVAKTPITEAVPAEIEPLFTPIQKLVTEVTERGRKEITPSELDQIRRSLRSTYEKAETHVGRELAQDLRSRLQKLLDDAINASTDPKMKVSLESLKRASSDVKSIATAQEKLGLPAYFSGLEKPETSKTAAVERIQSIIQNLQQPGTKSRQRMTEALTELEKVEPGLGKQLRQGLEEGSRKEYLARALERKGFPSGGEITPKTALQTSIESQILLGSAAAGKVARGTEKAGQKLLDVGKRAYEASPETIQKMADVALSSSSTGARAFADTLNKIAASGDQAKRRALMFTLMQQPSFRQFAEEFFVPEKENP